MFKLKRDMENYSKLNIDTRTNNSFYCYSGKIFLIVITLLNLLFFSIQVYNILSPSPQNSQLFTLSNEEGLENSKNFINFMENIIENESENEIIKNKLYMTVPEMIQEAGYPSESHVVTTEDGYILTMHRIPYGKVNGSGPNDPKRVIFLQHGMFGTSADWIFNSIEKSLAYMLADNGYDVWLGNSRGNEYSTNHTIFSPKLYKFWKFSWHEMGYYDLPAELDYVLNETGRDYLYYTGHSMGTTMFFVLMATRPEYNQKIRIMSALGPAVYLNNTKSPIKYFATHWGRTEKILLDTAGHGILLPTFINKIIHWFAPKACTPELKIDKLCDWILALIFGHDPVQFNYSLLPKILAQEPSTVSSPTAFHYFQNIKSGGFHMYDPGFHTTHPPMEYNLSSITTPIAIYWGENDILCDPIDVARLANKLPNVVLNFKVNLTEFTHLDFVFAKDADILVNKPLINFLKMY